MTVGFSTDSHGQPLTGRTGGTFRLDVSCWVGRAVYGLVTVVGAAIAWPLLLRHVGSLDSRRITRSLVRRGAVGVLDVLRHSVLDVLKLDTTPATQTKTIH
jgi:hypothetical protein